MRLFMSLWLLIACSFFVINTPAIAGDDEALVIFEDNFSEDPLLNDWIILSAGSLGGWVPPESPYCEVNGWVDPAMFTPENPCTLYSEEIIEDSLEMDLEEFGGYMLVTPMQNTSAGAVFRTERALYDNIKMEITVELRDGSLGQPADGMTVVILGTDQPPLAPGCGGGGMAATGMGAGPTMIFEFDDWSCNFDDQNDDNHVAFAWARNGINCGDAIDVVEETFSPFPEPRLHNREVAPAAPNRFKMTVYIQGSTVACDLESLDQPGLNDNLGRMYTYTIPDFPEGGFEGYLGVTASTGGANQNHLLHHAKLSNLPEGFCLQPAGLAERDLQPFRTPETDCGEWEDGDQFPVELTVLQVRGQVNDGLGNVQCTAAERLVIKEVLPENWDGFDISDGGTIDRETGTITWVLEGDDAVAGKTLSYMCEAVDNGNIAENFRGRVQGGEGADFEMTATNTAGETTMQYNAGFDLCGGITCWNILGAFQQAGGAAPGNEAMRQDYLTDGQTSETNFVFFPGAQIAPDYSGAAASTGLFGDPNGRNAEGVPTVYGWNNPDGRIDLNMFYGGDPNDVMAYTQCYVDNTTGDDLETYIGVMSDDSIQVLVNGQEVWIHSIPRGGTDACNPQDVSPDNITFFDTIIIEPGLNSILIKTFEGGGDFNVAFRFQDEFGQPITEGLEVSKYPPGICPTPPVVVARSIVSDARIAIQLDSFPSYVAGGTYDISLRIANIREEGDCAATESVTLTERVPEDWVISNVSGDGSVEGNTITWVLEGDSLVEGNLSYSVRATNADGNAQFAGKIAEADSDLEFAVIGDSRLVNPTDATPSGFFRKWLLLGPYQTPVFGFGAAPSEANVRADLMTDGGDITELTALPEAGDIVETDFAVARSVALMTGVGDAADVINPDGLPTWYPWVDSDSMLDFNHYYGGDLNNNVMYAVIYLYMEDDMDVDIGLSSDDAVQVLLNQEEVHLNSVGRGWGDANQVQDIISSAVYPQLAPLEAGMHMIMVKVFEGGGGHGFHLRLQDPFTGEPITEGFRLCFSPDEDACISEEPPPPPAEICDNGIDDDGDGSADCDDGDCADAGNCQAPAGPTFVRGDANSDGSINLTDGVIPLLFLFSGGAPPACGDAADTNDTGSVEITDAIIIFSWLFTGGAPPAEPSPRSPGYTAAECGVDATEDGLGCENPAPVCP